MKNRNQRTRNTETITTLSSLLCALGRRLSEWLSRRAAVLRLFKPRFQISMRAKLQREKEWEEKEEMAHLRWTRAVWNAKRKQ